MIAASKADLRAVLLERAGEITRIPAEALLDDDGDVILGDSPFGMWGRIQTHPTSGEPFVVFVMAPLVELEHSAELDDAVRATLAGRSVEFQFGGTAIQLFAPRPITALDSPEVFRQAFDSVFSVAMSVIDAVQPRFGGLTPVQKRVLSGWRGQDAAIEADLRAILEPTGGELLAHGWDPRSESLPLLVTEESVPRGWARRFVTVDAGGAVSFRSSIPGVRDGGRGAELNIHRLDAHAARTWAGRMGIPAPDRDVRKEDITSLAGRPWQELMDAMNGLPRQSGDAWAPVELGS
jgi:hypothetical protein